jgi:nitroimidazol reductase NimA-like FMN-containing flavoprotein (pyridoxamine 5'-phosphate oxidase superfamily)
MSEPIMTLDPRYSVPDPVATDWETTRQALETAQVFWLSTMRPDGRLHVTPIVAVWLDGAMHFCTGEGRQKAINLRNSPHVTLMTGCNHWEEGLDVVVEGDAVRVADQEQLERLAKAWSTKWDGRYQFVVRDGSFSRRDAQDVVLLVYSITPAQVFAFSRGHGSSHTRHQF